MPSRLRASATVLDPAVTAVDPPLVLPPPDALPLTPATAIWHGATPMDAKYSCTWAASAVASVLQSGRFASGAPALRLPISDPSEKMAMAPSLPTHRTRPPADCSTGVEPNAKRDFAMS